MRGRELITPSYSIPTGHLVKKQKKRGQLSWIAEHNNDVQLRLAMSITGYSMRLFIIMCFILIIYDGKLHGFLFMGQHDRRHAGYESGKIRLISPADNISRHWSCGGFRAGPVFVYIP